MVSYITKKEEIHMVEYLKKYKKLLELKEINEKEIQENKQLIRENHQKWSNTKDKEEVLDSEIKFLNEKYNDKMSKKEKRLFTTITVILILISLIGIILIGILIHPVIMLPATAMAIVASSSIHMIFYILIKLTTIFKKQFYKDKNISNLLGQIETKEEELSDIKKICDEYSQQLIKYRTISKNLVKKEIWINESINELMRNYATPIFEEQLKNIDEETLESSKQKTKKKIKNNEL